MLKFKKHAHFIDFLCTLVEKLIEKRIVSSKIITLFVPNKKIIYQIPHRLLLKLNSPKFRFSNIKKAPFLGSFFLFIQVFRRFINGFFQSFFVGDDFVQDIFVGTSYYLRGQNSGIFCSV